MINFRASELPELRAKLVSWLEGRHEGEEQPTTFFTDPETVEHGKASKEDLIEWMTWRARFAQLYYVNPDMSELVSHAAVSLPDERLHADLMPTDIGIVVWAKPVGVCRGALWTIAGEGLTVLWLADTETDYRISTGLVHEPQLAEEMERIKAKWTDTIHSANRALAKTIILEETDEEIQRIKAELADSRDKAISRLHDVENYPELWDRRRRHMGPLRASWMNHVRWREPLHYPESDTATPIQSAGRRWWREAWSGLLTTWTLMQQTITVSETQHPLRPSEARKLRRRGQDPTVTYVRLRQVRHIDHDPDSDTAREYHHRWLVTGHWRKQPYPSTGEIRPIWISPYIKGPEGAPLLKTEKVYTLVR